MTVDQLSIRELIAQVNDAWLSKRGEALTNALNACFADDVVMRGPSFQLLGTGRAFAVQSYHDFVTQAEVEEFSIEEPGIDVIGDLALALYKWAMMYRIADVEYTEQGRDVFALSKVAGKWLIAWRAMLPGSL